MSDTMPNPAENAAQLPQPWDPFQLMDRLDEEALRKELDGLRVEVSRVLADLRARHPEALIRGRTDQGQ